MKISPLFLDLIQHQQCSTSLAESQSWPRKQKLDNLWGGRTSRLVIWQGLPDARRQASLLAAPQTSGGLRRRSHGTRDTGHGTCDTTVLWTLRISIHNENFYLSTAKPSGPGLSRAVECPLESTTLAFLSFLFRPKTASKSPAVTVVTMTKPQAGQ
jgi:hypothetical protein